MVSGLAFLATAVATVFAEATLVRYTRAHKPHEAAWTVALIMFALAAAALAMGTSTGWDQGTFRMFFLFGAVLDVPWLALGTVYLLGGQTAGRRTRAALVFASGLAVGVMLTAPIHGAIAGDAIPVGKSVFGVFPRVLAAVGSGLGATVIFVGAAWSAWRFARGRSVPGNARLAGSNVLIALGTLVLSVGGLTQGLVGKDSAFTLSLAVGIAVIYGGFLVAAGARRPVIDPVAPDDGTEAGSVGATVGASSGDAASGSAKAPSAPGPRQSKRRRRSSLPVGSRGSDSTTSTVAGTL